MFSHESDNWNTPEIVLNAVRRMGDIGLDPCGGLNDNVNAKKRFTTEDDGLVQDWRGYSNVFINPPYSQIKVWVKKTHESYQDRKNDKDSYILLIPARTDTKYFQDYCFNAPAVCFWRGRLKFSNSKQ